MPISIPPFVHRHNENGSYDSICTTCFRTVFTHLIEAKLQAHEMTHLCYGRADQFVPHQRIAVMPSREIPQSRRQSA